MAWMYFCSPHSKLRDPIAAEYVSLARSHITSIDDYVTPHAPEPWSISMSILNNINGLCCGFITSTGRVSVSKHDCWNLEQIRPPFTPTLSSNIT